MQTNDVRLQRAHAVVVVLGDTGRSPRMQFHAASLANMPCFSLVTIVGYEGERCIATLRDHRKVKDRRINTDRLDAVRAVPVVGIALKGLVLMMSLLYIMATLPTYEIVLIQNPPCIPAVIVAYILSIFNGSKIIIDWHNLGFSMFLSDASDVRGAIENGHNAYLPSYPARVTRLLEGQLWWMCNAHLCVSQQMANWLTSHFSLPYVTVLYDRPPAAVFQNLYANPDSSNGIGMDVIAQRKHNLLSKLGFTDNELFPQLLRHQQRDNAGTSRTVLTQKVIGGGIEIRSDNAAFLVSSTSWTPDEDFTLLERCLRNVDDLLNLEDELVFDVHMVPARLVVVVTGKGPRRDAFLASLGIAASPNLTNAPIGPPLKRVAVKAMWLEPEDYPVLLSCADLGVCLHTSTSGLDLPMKVLDMFGAGVPVCAVKYGPVLAELVRDNENGRVFNNSDQLTKLVMEILFPRFCDVSSRTRVIRNLKPRPDLVISRRRSVRLNNADTRTLCDDYDVLKALQRGVRSGITSWEDNWNKFMAPVVLDQLLAVRYSKYSSKRNYLAEFLFAVVLSIATFVTITRRNAGVDSHD